MSIASVETPTDPTSRFRYFPGWTMLTIATAANFMSAPGQSFSVAAFNGPMRSTLRLSEVNYSAAYGFATILSGLALPFVGRLIDRYGARRILPIIAVFLGLACFWMSSVESLKGLYVGFTLIRCLGQGALVLISTWIVGEWFERKRGFATAIAGLGSSLSVMTFPLLNNWIISDYGWSIAWRVLAVMVWVVLFLPSIFVLRDRPEDLGLTPDGLHQDKVADDHKLGKQTRVISPTKDSWEVSEVIRNATFWKLLAVPATSGLVGTGVIFHQVNLLGSRGVSQSWALGLISVQALTASSIALFVGWLTDRVQSRRLLALAMALLAASIATVWVMPTPAFAILFAVCMGLHGSILRSTGTVVWINYFGRGNQGAIRGVAYSVMILASAFGPLPLAMSIQYLKSFDPAIIGFLCLPIISMLLVWTAKQPQHPTRKR